MPDSQNRMDNVFKKYDDMSTEELQQILREDASKSEGEETSMEALLYVMKVLANRRQAQNEGKSPEEALGSFMQNYYVEDDKSSGSERNPSNRKHNPGFRRWMSGLIAAAAMFVLIIGSSLTASALGFDLWDIILTWTKETFHLGYSTSVVETADPNEKSAEVFLGLQEALDDYDIEIPLVPAWIPEGYKEVDIKVEDTPKQRRFAAVYQLGEESIRIRIVDYLDSAPTQVEQSDSIIEVYTSNETEFYIVSNYDQLRAVWIKENYECCIMGPLTITEIKTMIDSIGKG